MLPFIFKKMRCPVASGLYYKSFTNIINDHNDRGQYYKTKIANVSYARNLALEL